MKKGFTMSEASKEKMRLAKLGKPGNHTQKHTSESKERNRNSHLGKVPWNKGLRKPKEPKATLPKERRIISDQTRQRMRDSHLGKPSPRKGVCLSDETKEKLSISHKIPDDERTGKYKICKGCGCEFYVTPSRERYGWGIYHSKKCQHKYEVQENSPQWKGGIAPLRKVIQGQPEYINWRNAIFERDDYRDWFSGCRGNIEAHHIVKFSTLLKIHNVKTLDDALKCESLWDVNNGITLLRASHKAFHEMFGW